MVSSPFKCWSTGREPMAQPPGRLTSAAPKRASVGPSTKMEARMVFTNSYGAQVLFTVPPLILNSLTPSLSTSAPMPCRSLCVVFTSASIGTLVRCRMSSVKSPAHISGRAAFFAPEITISPCNGPLPVIFSLSMFQLNFFNLEVEAAALGNKGYLKTRDYKRFASVLGSLCPTFPATLFR